MCHNSVLIIQLALIAANAALLIVNWANLRRIRQLNKLLRGGRARPSASPHGG